MSEPMAPERLAEIRSWTDRCVPCGGCDDAHAYTHGGHVAELLAEVDRLTAEVQRLTSDRSDEHDEASVAYRERDAARAQLAEIHALVDHYHQGRRQAFDRGVLAGAVLDTVAHQRAEGKAALVNVRATASGYLVEQAAPATPTAEGVRADG